MLTRPSQHVSGTSLCLDRTEAGDAETLAGCHEMKTHGYVDNVLQVHDRPEPQGGYARLEDKIIWKRHIFNCRGKSKYLKACPLFTIL